MRIGKKCFTDTLWRPNGRTNIAVNGYVKYKDNTKTSQEIAMYQRLLKEAKRKGYSLQWVAGKYGAYKQRQILRQRKK